MKENKKRGNFFSRKILRKIIYPVVAMFILSGAVTAYFGYEFSRNMVLENQTNQMNDQTVVQLNSIYDLFLDNIESTLGSISRTQSLREDDMDRLAATMES